MACSPGCPEDTSPVQKITARMRQNAAPGAPDSLTPDAGLSPDAPTTVTRHGGKQSYLGVDFTQLDAAVMFEAAATMYAGGEKYGRDNWKSIEVEDHINHALTHLYGWLKGDRQDDHLVHAMVRAMMARVVERDGMTRAPSLADFIKTPPSARPDVPPIAWNKD